MRKWCRCLTRSTAFVSGRSRWTARQKRKSKSRPNGSVFVFHRPAGGDHAFVAADERPHFAIAHLLRDIAGERRPESTTAIHDDLRFGVGNFFLEIAFRDAFADM